MQRKIKSRVRRLRYDPGVAFHSLYSPRPGDHWAGMDAITLPILLACLAITLGAGFVKGAVGFAMPLVMVSGISMLLDPQTTVAAIVIPIVATNLWQAVRTGWRPAVDAVREHRLYVALVCGAILAFGQLLPRMDPATFSLILGVPVTILAALQLMGWRPRVAPARRRLAEVVGGLVSGALGGMAGTWGPTTVLYLLALEVPKARAMVVQGVVYGTGAVALLIAHLISGVVSRETLPLSLFLLAPGLLGIWLGFKAQDRLDQDRFRRWTLIVLVVAGLNLIRRGVMG